MGRFHAGLVSVYGVVVLYAYYDLRVDRSKNEALAQKSEVRPEQAGRVTGHR